MADPVPFPSTGDSRVIVYCLSCGHRTWTMRELVEARFGCVPFGMITGKLRCKSGCGDNFGVVLPLDAPDPRAWTRKYGTPPIPREPPGSRPARPVAAWSEPPERPESQVVELDKSGHFIKVHCVTDDLTVLNFAFETILQKSVKEGRRKHLIARRGATWMRDSKRDFKIVGGALVEFENDPEADAEMDEP